MGCVCCVLDQCPLRLWGLQQLWRTHYSPMFVPLLCVIALVYGFRKPQHGVQVVCCVDDWVLTWVDSGHSLSYPCNTFLSPPHPQMSVVPSLDAADALPNITSASLLGEKTFLDVQNYFQPQINGGFVLVAAYLVFFMHAGFCMVCCVLWVECCA